MSTSSMNTNPERAVTSHPLERISSDPEFLQFAKNATLAGRMVDIIRLLEKGSDASEELDKISKHWKSLEVGTAKRMDFLQTVKNVATVLAAPGGGFDPIKVRFMLYYEVFGAKGEEDSIVTDLV